MFKYYHLHQWRQVKLRENTTLARRRRRFFAIREKPQGGLHQPPPLYGRGLNILQLTSKVLNLSIFNLSHSLVVGITGQLILCLSNDNLML